MLSHDIVRVCVCCLVVHTAGTVDSPLTAAEAETCGDAVEQRRPRRAAAALLQSDTFRDQSGREAIRESNVGASAARQTEEVGGNLANASLASLEAEVQLLKDAEASKALRMSNLEKEVQLLTTSMQQAQRMLKNVEATNATRQIEVKKIQDEFDTMGQMVSDLQTANKSHTVEAVGFASKLEQVTNLAQHLSRANKTQQVQIESLQQQTHALDAETKRIGRQVLDLNASKIMRIGELQGKITELEREAATLRSANSTQEASLAVLRARVSTLDKNLTWFEEAAAAWRKNASSFLEAITAKASATEKVATKARKTISAATNASFEAADRKYNATMRRMQDTVDLQIFDFRRRISNVEVAMKSVLGDSFTFPT